MISRFHHITQDNETLSHVEQARLSCEGGAKWIQLRVKNQSIENWLSIAQQVKNVCKEFGTQLIINDNVQIAIAINADGVHLGKTDMSVAEARKILGKGKMIGATANTFEDAKDAFHLGADYLGVGPFRNTVTKENLSPILGLEGMKVIIEKCCLHNINIPLIAIGGIKVADTEVILNSGIYGVAVSSAINLSENPVKSCLDFLNIIEEYISRKAPLKLHP